MDLNNYLSGKISLNYFIHRLNQNGASFHIHYWGVMPNHYDTQWHKHSFFEVVYVIKGEGVYIEDDRTYPLQENTLFLSRPEVLHQIKSKKGLSLLYVAFDLIDSESSESWIKIMETAKQSSNIILYDVEETETALLWRSLLLRATNRHNEFFEEMLSNTAYGLILSILQDFVPLLNKSHPKQDYEQYSALLTQAQLYIHDNLSNSLRLTEVAKHLHISGRHLSRIFVAELGVSFSKYVQDERIKKAMVLLKRSKLSIKEISEETGFMNVHYFTRVFSDMMQTSPGKFRSLYFDKYTTTFSEG
ncbi:AraC family transcriptional regulator [Fictibacillus enclensis]|uniref:AraC family transcriptional regulator n=1 Tax=Fictibacillus enclensis TaxID=1017270 RepID=UPI0025A18F27|nr:AraC family transcriptional regulator [Fictibacillus enclensis]MDM5336199.1 AraC family transcriptional regulator [Fictibacillus enclensis]